MTHWHLGEAYFLSTSALPTDISDRRSVGAPLNWGLLRRHLQAGGPAPPAHIRLRDSPTPGVGPWHPTAPSPRRRKRALDPAFMPRLACSSHRFAFETQVSCRRRSQGRRDVGEVFLTPLCVPASITHEGPSDPATDLTRGYGGAAAVTSIARSSLVLIIRSLPARRAQTRSDHPIARAACHASR